MKSIIMFVLLIALSTGMVYAGGDQNHGDVGTGTTDQGDTGSDTGNASGDDAQDNQA